MTKRAKKTFITILLVVLAAVIVLALYIYIFW